MIFFKKKLNPLDTALIVFVLLAVCIFAVVFFRKSTYVNVTVRISEDSSYWTYTGSRDWFVRFFREGQMEKDGLGNVQAEVLRVQSYDKAPGKKVSYLTTKLKVIYSRASGSFTYKGIPVLVGSKIKLNLDRLLVEGTIVDVEGFGDEVVKKKVIVEGQLREESPAFLETAGVEGYLADAISMGDVVKDGGGEVVVRVLKKQVLPAEKTTVSSDGRTHLTTDPIRKDVFLTLEVSTSVVGDKYFFLYDIPVIVDFILPINTSTYSIFPVITKIVEVK